MAWLDTLKLQSALEAAGVPEWQARSIADDIRRDHEELHRNVDDLTRAVENLSRATEDAKRETDELRRRTDELDRKLTAVEGRRGVDGPELLMIAGWILFLASIIFVT